MASVLVSEEVLRSTKTSTVEKRRLNVTVTKVRLNVCIVSVRELEVIEGQDLQTPHCHRERLETVVWKTSNQASLRNTAVGFVKRR